MLKITGHHAHSHGHWLILSKDSLWIPKEGPPMPLLRWEQLAFIHHYEECIHQLKAKDLGLTHPLFVVDMGAESLSHEAWKAISLRDLMCSEPPVTFEALARAWQYVHFVRTHKFCGRCGHQMQPVDWEMAVQCHRCSHRCYPRVSPCTIVAVYRGNELLLARGVRHRDADMYSVLAGFVESGESIEQATHREVQEEVGVNIKNLEYFGSQAWPFPHSLMVGYFAEYDSGDIVIDKREIVDAHWYHIDDLPKIPSKLSIAGKMIESIVEKLRNT